MLLRSLFLFSVLVAVQAQFEIGIPVGDDFSPFINNGLEGRIEDFPYVASIRRNALHIGGGAIVSSTWVVSVAHILLGCPPTQVTVRAGSAERVLGGSLHNAQKILLHPSLTTSLNNDVALINVMEPFIFSTTLSAVLLDVQGTTVLPGTVGVVPGFGIAIPANQNLSPVLRFASMTVQPTAACHESLSPFMEITANMLCTTSTNHNPCHGDFGGPLVANNRLIGVAAWNPFCTNAGYSTAFTRIAANPVRAWIREVVGF